MRVLTAKFIVLGFLMTFVLTGCVVENLPINSNNTNANANNLPKNTASQNPAVSPAQNVNLSQNQNNSANLPESNTTLPPYNSASVNANSEIIVVSKLIVPVQGIKKEDLRDTFTDSRSEGRTHNALDIMAAVGTPVIAATDGKIVKFHDSELGGITIYQLATDGRLVLYYAHLQSRAAGIAENMDVKKGTVIGYVGDTGNAGAGNYHLHFAMWIVDDPKRYWEGANVNPYQYLR